MMKLRILDACTKVTTDEFGKTITYDWNCRTPLFESSNIDEAYNAYIRMCEEAYRPHLMLIVDFGAMSLKQAFRCNRKRNSFLSDNNFSDVTPYITLGEWHLNSAKSRVNYGLSNPQLFIKQRGGVIERTFDNPYNALWYITERYLLEEIELYMVENFSNGVENFRKIRKVVDSDLLKRTRFNGCTKIRTERYLRKKNIAQ